MIVMGGYNSSNTDHLAHLCREFTTTYHIEDTECIDLENGTIRHKPDVGSDTPEEIVTDWMPEGAFDLGMTAGASTPNNKIGEALLRILEIRGGGVRLERCNHQAESDEWPTDAGVCTPANRGPDVPLGIVERTATHHP